jgi:hypothetical protein
MNEGTPLGVKSTISRYGCSAVNGPHSGTFSFYLTPGRKILSKATVRNEELFEILDHGKCFAALIDSSGETFS